MAQGVRLTDAERQEIIGALRAGESLHSIVKRTGRGRATVGRIAKAAGIDLVRTATQKATAARLELNASNRLDLLNKAAAVADRMLERVKRPIELQHVATTIAILIDKRRLEDGEATQRTEVSHHGARERVAGRLDELAARRGSKQAAG